MIGAVPFTVIAARLLHHNVQCLRTRPSNGGEVPHQTETSPARAASGQGEGVTREKTPSM